MCGILGEVSCDRYVDGDVFVNRLRALATRGPDGEGVAELNGGRVWLGHRRLSIIDLSDAASQPMCNEDETCWLTFNGEVYNFRELRRELQCAGHRFRSQSDSEVIIHGYEEWGDEVVRRLRGIFAFGIWDECQGRLLVARDHLGVKPVYYRLGADGGFAFASQPRALLGGKVDRDVDSSALDDYLSLGYVTYDRCIFRGMKRLPPAHRLVWEDGRTRVERFWELCAESTIRDEDEAVDRVRKTLETAVESQTVSDVPVGVFTSGGVDSSAVASIASDKVNGRVKAFTIGFGKPEYDERPYARVLHDRLGMSAVERVLEPDDALALLSGVVEAYDEPFFGGSAFPTLMVSQLACESGCSVVLAGDGGDELFAGYTRYDQLSQWDSCGSVGARFLNVLGIGRARDRVSAYYRTSTMRLLSGRQRRRLMGKAIGCDCVEDVPLALTRFHRPDLPAATAARYMDVHCYLPDHILCKVDRASMSCGVEVRVPVLDRELVELAFMIDERLVYRDGERKSLLKKALVGYVPDELLSNRKKGFSIPLAEWMKGQWGQGGRRVVLDGTLVARGILNPRAVAMLYDFSHARWRWLLLGLELWARRWLEGLPVSDAMQQITGVQS